MALREMPPCHAAAVQCRRPGRPRQRLQQRDEAQASYREPQANVTAWTQGLLREPSNQRHTGDKTHPLPYTQHDNEYIAYKSLSSVRLHIFTSVLQLPLQQTGRE